MPDRRQHRGRNPADREAFAPKAVPQLRAAVADLSWLLTKGYAPRSALKLVGDRYTLFERQRIAVMRCACSDADLLRRRQHQVTAEALAGGAILIDGYNVLTTIEAALAGGIVIVGRDGCYRDMASMHGTFRTVAETNPAIELLGRVLADMRVAQVIWFLDRPVSNSGRLKTRLLETARNCGWLWQVELVINPDDVLADTPDIVASADSVILDRCERWFNLVREAVIHTIPDAEVLEMM